MKYAKPNQDNYNVLVVCNANKGRSASYHAHFKHLLNERGVRGIAIDSAGFDEERINEFYRQGNTGANPWIKEILVRERVPEILEHRIKAVDEGLVDRSHKVLAFETHMRDSLRSRYPQHSDKIYTVREYTSPGIPEGSLDVDDAYNPKSGLYRGKIPGRTMKAFAKVSNESRRLAIKTLDKVMDEIENDQK